MCSLHLENEDHERDLQSEDECSHKDDDATGGDERLTKDSFAVLPLRLYHEALVSCVVVVGKVVLGVLGAIE